MGLRESAATWCRVSAAFLAAFTAAFGAAGASEDGWAEWARGDESAGEGRPKHCDLRSQRAADSGRGLYLTKMPAFFLATQSNMSQLRAASGAHILSLLQPTRARATETKSSRVTRHANREVITPRSVGTAPQRHGTATRPGVVLTKIQGKNRINYTKINGDDPLLCQVFLFKTATLSLSLLGRKAEVEKDECVTNLRTLQERTNGIGILNY